MLTIAKTYKNIYDQGKREEREKKEKNVSSAFELEYENPTFIFFLFIYTGKCPNRKSG